MIALRYLKNLKIFGRLPMSKEKPCTYPPSNSEIKRWLRKKSVRINNEFPDVNDEIEFPVTDLVFFAKSKSKCTMC